MPRLTFLSPRGFCSQALNILELLLRKLGLSYRRMDGKTPLRKRHAMLDAFNADEDIFCFLLTNKVISIAVSLFYRAVS